MDEYNPLSAQLREQTADLDELRAAADEQRDQLGWHQRLDPDAAIADAESEADRLAQERASLTLHLDATRSRIRALLPFTLLQYYPPAYVSKRVRDSRLERKAAKAELAAGKTRLSHLDAEHTQAVEAIATHRAEAERHATFDADAARTRLSEIEDDIAARTPGLESLAERAAALDDELAGPLPELIRKKQELSTLEALLARARDYQSRLNATTDGTARWRIHREREDDLGHTPLREVIRDAERDTRVLRRDIPKLEERVRDIVRVHMQDVRKLVIDGNNLCYVDRKVVGLWPLREVLAHVDGKVDVAVYFDNTIVETLNLRDVDQLYDKLSAVPHLTAPGTRADETILDAASEAGTYVLSNDRFKDFPDKPAVRDDRLLRHEIFDGRIKVRGLRLDTVYRTTL